MTPERIRPVDAAACARAVTESAAASQTLRVRGAGTKDYLGEMMPTDAVLETTALSGIIAHVPADLTVSVAAGTPFTDLRSVLAKAGQFLPLDPPHSDTATIGGIVAANSTGFWRARYGGVRDLLIGTTAVLGDGTLAHSGGRVVKNVAGYDLNKLFVGSLGTLGVLVECTFKVVPVPSATAGVRARFTQSADAFAAADQVARTSARPAALVVVGGGDGGWELLLQADGDRAPVARTLELFASAARDSGGSAQRDDAIAVSLSTLREMPANTEGVIVRASIPVAAQGAYAESAARLDGFAQLVGDAATGIVRVRIRGDDYVEMEGANALMAAAHVCGGSAQAERRPRELHRRLRPWWTAPSGLELMLRLKAAFDPRGVLEPGRCAADGKFAA